jgi:hypothetical protein
MFPMSQRKPIPENVGEFHSLNPETGRLTRKKNSPRGVGKAGEYSDTNVHKSGYVEVRIPGDPYMYRAHRVVWFLHYGEQPPEYIDHINGDRTDNRPENLRKACHHTNLANAKLSTRNTSGVKGVHWAKNHNKWVAKVGFKGKKYIAGYFDNIAEAEIAVRQLREQLHGDFTNHG